MSSGRYSSVEEYLGSLDPAKAKTLRHIIDTILAQFSGLDCKISWNVPQIHRNGAYVFGVNAFKHHLTLAPWSPRVIKAFKRRLRPYVVKKYCFQIPVDWDIDKKLLKDLVRARLAELDEKSPDR